MNDVARGLELPELQQVGIVVDDIPSTVRRYQALGIGPWFRPQAGPKSYVMRGGERLDTQFDLVIAYSGALQIELIQPQGGEESIYTDHLRDHGEGLHHLGFCVSDLDRRLLEAERAGFGVLQSGLIASSGGARTRYAYLDTAERGGVILELIEPKLLGLYVGMSRLMIQLGTLTGDVKRLEA
jgi:hypothetical protein